MLRERLVFHRNKNKHISRQQTKFCVCVAQLAVALIFMDVHMSYLWLTIKSLPTKFSVFESYRKFKPLGELR